MQGKMTRILMYDVHALGVDVCFTRRQVDCGKYGRKRKGSAQGKTSTSPFRQASEEEVCNPKAELLISAHVARAMKRRVIKYIIIQ